LTERGDIYFVDLDPVRGRAQQGHRPVFVVTTGRFNALTAPLVAPITSGGAFARHRGFAVELAPHTSRVQGVVLCNQLRTLDLTARNGRFVEHAPQVIIDDVLAKIATLIA
jgi:mRNA-degrading endonuclease toxin of MazEF toxin-antitoxin module